MTRLGSRRRSIFHIGGMASCAAVTVSLLAFTAPPAMANEADWQARSTGPGVVRAIRFDNEAEVRDHVHPDRGNGNISFDTSIKASGNGSMRFVIPSNSDETAGSGSWRMNFSDYPFDVQFGENSEFFVQWRQRFDPYMLTHVYNASGGWKQIIIGQGDVPGVEARACTELELVVQNLKHWRIPQAYHACGVYTPYNENNGNDWLLQNVVGCRWRNGNPDPFDGSCVPYYPDEFMTFQVRMKLGPWVNSAPDRINGNTASGFYPSEFEMWIAREGEPAIKTHRFTDIIYRRGNYSDDPVDASHTARYGKIWLSTYNTGKSASETHQEASTWYDEIIISTSRIPDPLTTQIRPNPPTAVRTN